MEPIKLKKSAFCVQLAGTICLCFMACQTGFTSAWPSYTIELFKSNETVLSTPMSTYQVSLLGSLFNIGALIATPFCGYAFNNFGRKNATILFGLPFVISWTLIALSKNVVAILIAVTIAGIGVVGQNVSMIYISEISHDSIRGAMTASTASGYVLGLLISYTLGGYLSYYQAIYTQLTLAVLSILLMMFLYESPVYLVLAGKEDEAAKSIAFYNRIDIKSKEVEIEIRRIKIQLDPRLEKILEAENDHEITSELISHKLGDIRTNNESSWRILLKSKSSKRALTTVLVLMTLSIMMGNLAIQIYAEPLFKEAVPSMPSNLCSILLAVDYFVASIICLFIIDRYGRKILMTVTSSGAGICTLLLGAQLQFHWAPNWFTVVLIHGFSFLFSVGCGVIPFVLAAEVFLPEVRSLCSSIVMGCLWIISFIVLFIFNPLVEILGLGPIFYCFTVICFLTTIYTHIRLPETKGISVDEIQAMFLRKNK